MLILAIDTALDACAAAVLDTETGQLIAVESQAMKRGHAEALMPLIGRVMEQIDDKTLLMILSDHGFKSFQRCMNLNAWLHQNGYLALKDGKTEYMMLQPETQTCVKSIAPHFGYTPCWYLEGHKQQRTNL